MASKPQPAPAAYDGSRAAAIRQELERILQSPSFRSSKRSQHFLTYVVEQALTGNPENLKERVIGIEVFSRDLSYDTSEDATVRVAANEVRKRLAQYHVSSQESTVRIDLPAGSYMPEIREGAAVEVLPGAKPTEALQSSPLELRVPAVSRKRIAVAVSIAVLALGAFATRASIPKRTLFDDFWAPLLDSPKPVLICLANPLVYTPPAHVRPELRGQNVATRFHPAPQPNTVVKLDVVPIPDLFVGAGDAQASSQFLALLAGQKKPAQLRISNDISFTDLRSSPAVLIGAYSNRWTMQTNKELRFAFDHFAVVDHATHKSWSLNDVSLDNKSPEDYAIITRLSHSHTGESVIIAAGITQYGTQAASEFLTNPRYLNDALAPLPDWKRKNVQILIHCRVMGSTPGPPEVIATHVW